ncbi:MAG TPA: sugar phosphate nucleotidyltransferase [Candidatus Krumholzibacteria bacterium]|nr:sugar phosphate nucleotidyltransferase [Candidatus Krumholzibacteria bacterium]HPD72587.1 sugar phosphate nucleotidyltransferase [Candidatus Krumholzibacteria bacterium]HRY40481.1 sugar phosphate nucleotidyltransferase [Candidatus Krumholzibacteria bacterium]
MPEVRGFVLAAGLGTRLAPLTDYVPKPLLPIAGVTLLDRAVAALTAAGIERIAINAHHRADRIAARLACRPDQARFHLSVEPAILGTGGAFAGAREFLAAADTIVVHNGDVLCDLDVGELLAVHRRGGALATLALVDRPAVNSVVLGHDGGIRDLADRRRIAPAAGDRRLTFTGLACYDRAFLERVPEGRSDLVTLLVAALDADAGAVRGHVHAGAWEDIGTLARYLDAHRSRLGPGFVSVPPSTSLPLDADLAECVVLPGATVPPATRLRRAVIGPGWAVVEPSDEGGDLRLAATAGFDDVTQLEWIEGHGSDRRFVRLCRGERRAVLMRTTPADPDYDRYLAIATFLYERGLGAPVVLAHDPASRSILLEDLGDATLERLVAREPHRAADLYDRVLDRLADLQTFGADARALCPAAWERTFDRDHLRWETAYFRERFLVGHCGLAPAALAGLDREFAALAEVCLRQPRTLVHRDFQSQNILVKDGVVRLVDVQGMRWGPQAYDVVSLVHDPYVDLAWPLREDLLAGFPQRLAARGGPRIAPADWHAMASAAALQRLMQSLGAYGFLGHVKGRTAFLAHIGAAVSGLRAVLDRAPAPADSAYAPPDLPALRDILASVR